MHSLQRLSLLAGALAPGALADLNYLRNSELCASGCGVALFSVSFNGQPPAAMAGTEANAMACMDPLWAQSLFYCSTFYCTPAHLQRALASQNVSCQSYTGMTLPPYSAPNMQNISMVSQMQAMAMSYNNPVVPDQQLYEAGYRSSEYLNYAQYTNWDFVWGLYGFWGLVLIIGTVNRLLFLARSFSSPKPDPIEAVSASAAQQRRSPVARSNAWFQRRWAIPFAFGSRKWLPAGYCSLPTRLETFLIVFYVVMNFVFCFPGYHLYPMNDILYPETKQQLAKYLANRFGSLAVGNIPVVWLFATRNDPLLWLTGWSYATYSQFHRWSARVLLLLVISHATANSVLTTYSGKASYYSLFQEKFVQWGLVAILSFSILVGTSFYFMRNRIYDLWLIIHFVFAAVVLIAVFFHTKEVNGRYNGFLWFAVAIWAFDRAMRLGRLVYLNLVPVAHGAKATATYDAETDMVRVNVTDFFKDATPPPGAYYFVYEPARIRGYESHPFSLCTWPETTASTRYASVQSSQTGEKEKEAELDNVSTSSPDDAAGSLGSKRQHTFLIKPRAGFTRRLRNRASPPGASTAHAFPVLLEGPYGAELQLQKYTDVVMVVGGSGITAAVSRIYALLANASSPHVGPRVHLIWAVQRRALAEDVAQNELAAVLTHPRLQVDVYVTQKGDSTETASSVLPNAVLAGRPDVYAVLSDRRTRCGGSLAVLVCGPPAMEGDCRNAVARLLGESGPKVGFFDERFGW